MDKIAPKKLSEYRAMAMLMGRGFTYVSTSHMFYSAHHDHNATNVLGTFLDADTLQGLRLTDIQERTRLRWVYQPEDEHGTHT